MATENEQHSSSRRGDRNDGVDLKLSEPLPTEEEQQNSISEAEEKDTSAFQISQEDIDAILTRGSGIERGKYRIFEQYQKKETPMENIAFLKNEYGIGGAYPAVSSRNLSESHDAKGILIERRGSAVKKLLKWPEIEKRLGELIAADRYLNSAEKEFYPQYREQEEIRKQRQSISKEFASLVREYNEMQRTIGNEDGILNQYVLISCSTSFAIGDKLTHSRTKEGEFILPLMRQAMAVIGEEPQFADRCQIVLDFLNSSLAKDLEPTEEELNPPPKEYRYHIGDKVYLGASEYEVLSITENGVELSVE